MILKEFPQAGTYREVGQDNGRTVIELLGDGSRHFVEAGARASGDVLNEEAAHWKNRFQEISLATNSLVSDLAESQTAHEATRAELGLATGALAQLRAELVDAGRKAEATLASVKEEAAAEVERLKAENTTLAQKITDLENANSAPPAFKLKGVSADALKKLVQGGFDSAEKVKSADNETLLATGIKEKDLVKVREATTA